MNWHSPVWLPTFGVGPNLTGPNLTYNYQVLELRDSFNPAARNGQTQGNIIGFCRTAQLSNDLTNGGIVNGTEGNMLYFFDVDMYTVINTTADVSASFKSTTNWLVLLPTLEDSFGGQWYYY